MLNHPRLEQYGKRLEKWHELERKSECRRQRQDPHGNEDGDGGSSCSGQEEDGGVNSALTFFALDNMDEDNRKEWLKEKLPQKLSGFAGCKRMARDMVRAEREAARDTYVDGIKKNNPSASGVGKPKVRVQKTAPWSRKFLPGSQESGSSLPPSPIRVGLTCPPNRNSWVALYRNAELQAQRKRPTRSKTYRLGQVSEHRAFQITLAWLWGRHDLCCSSAVPRPSWVVDALADCRLCQAGESCDFMDHLRAIEQPIGQGGGEKVEDQQSDDSSLWEGEGSSDSLSSAGMTGPATVGSSPTGPGLATSLAKPPMRLKGKQRASSIKSPGNLPPTSSNYGSVMSADQGTTSTKGGQKLKVLLVGDSNAYGYCETTPVDSSLKKALSAHYDITVAAKSGTSWVRISSNVHRELQSYVKGQSFGRHQFDAIFTVLGTNDIPTLTARQAKWHQLDQAITDVAKALKDYLVKPSTGHGASSEHPSTSGMPIYITEPFCFEEGRNVLLFKESLQNVCKAEGLHFVEIKWDRATHCQVETKTPDKHFNVRGVHLLVDSLRCVCSSVASGAPHDKSQPLATSGKETAPAQKSQASSSSVSGASGVPHDKSQPLATSGKEIAPAQKSEASSSSVSGAAQKSWRISITPKPHKGSSRRSSGSSSSSSSRGGRSSSSDTDQRSKGLMPCAPPKLPCGICQIYGHGEGSCPLALAAATDGEWQDARRAVEELRKLYGSAEPSLSTRWQMISGPGILEILLPPDGNCLFGSLALGKLLLESLPQGAPIGHRGVSLTMEERGELGANCRSIFLDKIAEIHTARQQWCGLDLELALDIGRSWPSVTEYLARMKPPIMRKRQWGGYVEAALISYDWNIIVAIFVRTSVGKYVLLCEPVMPPGANPAHRICVVWSATHYDLLLVPPEEWTKAQQEAHGPPRFAP